MKIKNIDGLSAGEIQAAVKAGGKFVYYAWAASALFVTIKRTSGVYLVRGNQSRVFRGMRYTLLTMALGWWGLPFGPGETWKSLRVNFRGGKDVTDDVMSVVAGYALYEESRRNQSNQSKKENYV